MKFTPVAIVTAGLLAALTVPSFANSLGVADGYNAFIFNNMNQTSDSEGALAVGGDLTVSSYSVASKGSNSATNLVVGGNFNGTWGTVTGNAVVGGSVNYQGPTITGSLTANGNVTFTNGGSVGGAIKYGGTFSAPSYFTGTHLAAPVALPVDFAAAQTQLTDTSLSLSELVNNASIANNFGGLTFNGTTAGLNVFSIDASTLAHATGITFTMPTGGYALINVTGATSDTLPNVGFNLNANDVLWNFYGVSNITMGSFAGSILAPTASVNFSSGNLNGTLVALNLSGGGELHNYTFNHTITTTPTGGGSQGQSVPLPPAASAGGLLLAGLVIAKRIARKRTA